MPVLNVTWPDRVENGGATAQGFVNAAVLNEIKAVVNNNATILTGSAQLGATGLQTFAGPIASPSATIGELRIGVDAPHTISTVTLGLDFNVPTGVTHTFRINGAQAGRIEPPGTATASTATIITREKGDFRYPQLALATLQTFAGPLRVGDVQIGAAFDGTLLAPRISVPASQTLQFQSGISTGAIMSFRDSTNIVAAAIEIAGTALSSTFTLVTREKGDFRYLQLAGGTVTGATTFSASLTVGNFQINVTAGWIERTGGIAYRVGSGTVRHQFFLDNVEGARIEPVGTATAAGITVITREKGDARYTAISARRFKTNIVDALGLEEFFDFLVPKNFIWGGELPVGDERIGKYGIGFDADGVVEKVPAAGVYRNGPDKVTVEKGGEEVRTPGDPILFGLDPFTLLAIQHAKIVALEARIVALEGV